VGLHVPGPEADVMVKPHLPLPAMFYGVFWSSHGVGEIFTTPFTWCVAFPPRVERMRVCISKCSIIFEPQHQLMLLKENEATSQQRMSFDAVRT
jgi:hypothetical protein